MIASKVLVDNYYKGRDIVLQQLPGERTDSDIKFLTSMWLCDSSSVFASLDKNSLREVACGVTLSKYNPNELIYQQEEWIENFHVILRGSVSLLIDPLFRTKQLANQAAAANVDSLLKDSAGNKSAAQVSSIMHQPKAKQNRVCYGKQVRKLSAGEWFGQEALLQKEEMSPFTVFADEHVELLTVSMEVFDRTLLRHFQSVFLKRAKFLSQLELFSKWSPHLLRQVSISIKEKHYQLGECIFRQDMPVHSLYIIKSGSVKLSVGSNMTPLCHKDVVDQIEPERNYLAEMFAEDEEQEKKLLKKSVSMHTLNALSTASIRTQLSSQILSARGSFSRSSISGQIALPIAATPANQRRRRSSIPAVPVKTDEPANNMFGFKLHEPTPKNSSSLCDLGVGDMLCDVEALCQLKRQLFNAVCSSDTEVYVLDLYYFEQLLHKKAPYTVYQMMNRASQRVESWKERYSLQCGELFNPLLTVLGQLEEKLTSKGYQKGSGRKSAYSPEEIAHIAIEKLGKVITSELRQERKAKISGKDDTNKNTVHSNVNFLTLSSALKLTKPTRPLSCTSRINSTSANPTFIRFNSLQPIKIHDHHEDLNQSAYLNTQPIPPPSPYPVQQEKPDDISTTVFNEYDLESEVSNISILQSSQCSANLAKIRSELLEKIKSESAKQLRPASGPIPTLMWGTEQQRLEPGVRGDVPSIRPPSIVVPTAVRMDSISTVDSDVFEEEGPNNEQALFDMCNPDKYLTEVHQNTMVETVITPINSQTLSVSSLVGNNTQHQSHHKINEQGTLTSTSEYKLPQAPPTSTVFDTTIPQEYKALVENRPSSQKSFFTSSFKRTPNKRPSTAPGMCPSMCVSGQTHNLRSSSGQVVAWTGREKPRNQTTMNVSVLRIYTLSSQHSIPSRHRSTVPSRLHQRPKSHSPKKQTMQPRKHISLSSMEKEGNLHLARPWSGHRSRPPSAPAFGRHGPTERRKVPARPPVNLTPHMQRPYYL